MRKLSGIIVSRVVAPRLPKPRNVGAMKTDIICCTFIDRDAGRHELKDASFSDGVNPGTVMSLAPAQALK
jgi:hypothetical protein